MNSRGVQANTSTPSRPPVSGSSDVAGCGGGAAPRTTPRGTGPAPPRGGPRRRRASSSKRAVGLVEPQQVLALHVEHQHAQVLAASPTSVACSRAVSIRRKNERERGLGGDAADAADRHVAALAAVEEVEVDVDAARRRARARPAAAGPSRPRRAPGRARRRWRVRDLAAGIGRDPDLGLTRVTATCAERTLAAGSDALSATRWVSDSNDAPSYTASASVTTPYVRDLAGCRGPAVRPPRDRPAGGTRTSSAPRGTRGWWCARLPMTRPTRSGRRRHDASHDGRPQRP